MPRYRVELLDEAEADAWQVYVWIYENSLRSAEKFAEALDAARDAETFQLISESSSPGPPVVPGNRVW